MSQDPQVAWLLLSIMDDIYCCILMCWSFITGFPQWLMRQIVLMSPSTQLQNMRWTEDLLPGSLWHRVVSTDSFPTGPHWQALISLFTYSYQMHFYSCNPLRPRLHCFLCLLWRSSAESLHSLFFLREHIIIFPTSIFTVYLICWKLSAAYVNVIPQLFRILHWLLFYFHFLHIWVLYLLYCLPSFPAILAILQS